MVSRDGVKPNMRFPCCDCHYTYTGDQILDGSLDMFILVKNENDPMNSKFRCHLCQDERDEYRLDD